MRRPGWYRPPKGRPPQARRAEESHRPPAPDGSGCMRLALRARGAEFAPRASSVRARPPLSLPPSTAGQAGCGFPCDYITRDHKNASSEQDVADRNLPSVPDVPATVILAGRPPTMPAAGLPFDAGKYTEALYQLRLQRLRGWARAPEEFAVAKQSGHFVHRQEPQVVIDAIRRLLPM